MNPSLKFFLNTASEFTVTWGIRSHTLLFGHRPSNDGLVKHLLPLFIAESGGRRLVEEVDDLRLTSNDPTLD